MINRLFLPALPFLCAAGLSFTTAAAQDAPPTIDSIDWPEFMAKQDMHFTKLPRSWREAPHFGNALMGSMIEQAGNSIRMRIFRQDVQDHRDDTYGFNAYSRPHLLIGFFALQPKGKLTGCKWRKDLWNAELTGTITTDKGEIKIRHYVHAQDMAVVTEITPSAGEKGCEWSWHPAEAKTTRTGYPTNRKEIEAFAKFYGDFYADTLKLFDPNPKGRQEQHGDVSVWVQDLKVGGQYATAWTEQTAGESRTLIASTAYGFPEVTAGKRAVEDVEGFKTKQPDQWRKAHTDWWHGYYPQSFVTIPDGRLEALYWQTIYRLGCCAREGRSYVDTPGIWNQGGGWCYTTIDWNIQAAHWPLYAANRLDQSIEMVNHFYERREQMVKAVRPVEWQEDSYFLPHCLSRDLSSNRNQYRRFIDLVGSLPWMTHNFWMQYRYSMDETLLREKVFPIMRRSANFYLHMIEEGKDGKLHLQPTYSPESGTFKDCNFDLALLKWQCHTLLKTCAILKIDDPLIPKWKEIIERTIDFPVDNKGYRMGSDKSVVPHRHISQLMMIYPLHLVNTEQENETTNLNMRRSLDQANAITGLSGMVQAHSAPMAAHMGLGEVAVMGLKRLKADLHPNGFWHPASPCMEVSFSAANITQEMMLQSWSDPTKDGFGAIRIFPACPKDWKDVTFHNLRTEGAFLVSAERKEGKTQWIRIKSLAGAPCRIKPGIEGEILTEGKLTQLAPGEYSLDLKKGEEVILRGNAPSLD